LATATSGLASPFRSPIATEIGHAADLELRCRPEGAVPLAEQHRHVARVEVGGHEVGLGVAVQVADRNRDRLVSGLELRCRPEGAVPVAEQNRHAADKVGGHDVGLGVAVQVADRNRDRQPADVERLTRCEADSRCRRRPRQHQRAQHH
jgi:hypothetical protein